MADAGALVVCAAGAGASRSDLRQAAGAFICSLCRRGNLILGWLLTLSVIACVLAVVFLLVSGGSRALQREPASLSVLPWRGLSISAAFLLLVVGGRVYVGRFEQLFEHHTIFDGVTYTDAHVTLTGMLVVCVALVLGAVIATAGGLFAPRGRWLVAAVLPAVVCYAGVGVVGWYVSELCGQAQRASSRAALHCA